jgi:hypothetical protein
MRRLSAATAGVLLLLAAGPLRAACSVTGQVKLGELPIADADIATVLGGADPVTRGHSGADGRFSITVEPLPHDMQVLKLVVSKTGHPPVLRLLQKTSGSGCPLSPQEPVALDPGTPPSGTTTGGTATGSGDTEASLCAKRSSLGLTVFIAPYRIYGGGADQAAERLNRDLPEIVHHRILAFESSLAGVVSFPDVSVETICLPLTAAQGERAQEVGHNLNALGVIAGEGELRDNQGKTVIDLVSVFRTMPAYKTYAGVPLSIEDTIPSDSLRPSRIAEQMRDIWGKQIVLAYALQRLASLPASPDPAEIAKLTALMVSLRKTMTADDPLLGQVEQVQALLTDLKAGP